MISLLFVLVLLFVAAAVGRSILGILGIAPDSRAQRAIYSIPLGLGVMAYLTLAMGLLGLLYRWAALLAGALVVIASRRELAPTLADLLPRRVSSKPAEDPDPQTDSGQPPGFSPHPAGFSSQTVLRLFSLLALLIAGALALLNSFVSPAAHEWDALSYHLAVPKVYLAHHRVLYIPTDHHSNFPFTVQMLFTLGLMFGGYAGANLLHLSMAVLATAATIQLGRRYLTEGAGWLAAMVFVTSPIVLWEAGAAYTELGFTLYVVCSVAAILEYMAQNERRWLTLAALLMGFALSVKTLAFIPLAAIALLLAAQRRSGRAAAGFVGLALLVGCPFYLKSWIQTGNPVYPFAYRLFGGRDWNAELASAYSGEQTGFGQSGLRTSVMEDVRGEYLPYVAPSPFDRLRNLLLGPFDLVTVPRIFYNYNDPGRHAQLGFLFMALPPLLALTRGPPSAAIKLAALSLLWFTAWSVSMQYARYLIPALPLLALAGAAGALYLARSRRIVGAALGLGMLVQAGATLSYFASQATEQAARAFSPAARSLYLQSSINSYAADIWINGHSATDDGVVLFEETRGFYLDRPYIWGNGLHSLFIPYQRFRSGQDMADWFLARRIRYAILNLQFSPRLRTEADRDMLRSATATQTESEIIRRWYYDPARQRDIRNLYRSIGNGAEPPGYRDVYWRLLVGDAVFAGGAVQRQEASSRGAVVLEFRHRS